MKTKQFTVTIGIPAYNAEQNIARLLKALIVQQTRSVRITQIIVLSDASHDATLTQARLVKDSRIRVLNNKVRCGFAYGVKKILTSATSDVVVLLNDDIIVKNPRLIEVLCAPFLRDSQTGLVGGNSIALPSLGFIERVAEISFTLFKRMAAGMPSIHNRLTCDGKILALSKTFYTQIKFPKDLSDMGNVDAYLYFLCRAKHLKFYFIPRAMVFFKHVSTLNDFIKLTIRNRHSTVLLEQTFKGVVEHEPQPQKGFFASLKPVEVVAFFPQLVFLILLHYWIQWIDRGENNSFSSVWSLVESTKKLQNI